MATETLDSNKPIQAEIRKRRVLVNTFDSPWFNPRFIIGCAMILFVVLAGLLGPLFWDTRLALVASSPLNLPPAWVQYESPVAADVPDEETVPVQSEAAPTQASGFGSSGLGGSGLSSLMATQTSPEAQPTQASGFGASGLGGSSLSSLMATQAPTQASGFGSSGL